MSHEPDDLNRFDQEADDLLDRSIRALRDEPIADGPDAGVIADTLLALRSAQSRTIPLYRKMFQMKALTKIAAALLVACSLAALLFLSSQTSSFALADVAKKLRDAKTLSFMASTELPGGKAIKMKFLTRSDGRMRIETPGQGVIIIDHDTGRLLQLDTSRHTATITEMGADKGPVPDPVDGFKHMTGEKAKDLGDKVIDGRKVHGFETKDAPTMTVWADATTADAVQLEVLTPLGEGNTKMIMNEFVFDPKLEDSLFSTEPPAGFTVTKLDLPIEAMKATSGEEHLIAALRGYTTLSKGSLPPTIADFGAFVPVMSEATLHGTPEQKAIAKELPVHVGSIIPFLFTLPKDGWAYLGKGKTLNQPDTVIFWYVTDDKTYRAIYADLSVKPIKADALPKPEK